MNPKLKADYADVYKKTQIGWQFLIVVWIIVVIADRAGMLSNILAGILVFFLFIFGSLTIAVDKTFVWMQFGIGFIRMKFKLEEIESCSTVQNPWYHTLGIIPVLHGWSFSIFGLNAVELSMKNGKKYRIGTKQPEELCSQIQSNLN